MQTRSQPGPVLLRTPHGTRTIQGARFSRPGNFTKSADEKVRHVCLNDTKYGRGVVGACYLGFSTWENTDMFDNLGNPSKNADGINCCVPGVGGEGCP